MVKPMTPEEAALQLELVGHDFFVFTNSETKRPRWCIAAATATTG